MVVSDTVIPMPSVQRLGQHHRLAAAVATDGHAEPAAVAVDLGSGQTRLWAAGAGIRIAPAWATR